VLAHERRRALPGAGVMQTAPPAAAASDAESRVAAHHHDALRLWLRLYACTATIEGEVRARLRERFAITLPRFDLLSQLERYPQGLKMGELSRRMMVTGGNVTGLTDQLVAEGLVERRAIPGDRRAHAVCLTAEGRAAFAAMAEEHERWIVELTAALGVADREALYELLGSLKRAVGTALEGKALHA
jgi:DNA-binding MarR family transcriptional regulator